MNPRVLAAGILAVALFFAVSSARADSITDPSIKTGGGSPPAVGIITPDFSILSPSGSSPGTSPCVLTQNASTTPVPSCIFENDIVQNTIGVTITSLIFDAPGIDPIRVTCGFLSGTPFASCVVASLLGGGTQITFEQGSIPFQSAFSLNLEGFPANSAFGTTASAVPEPSTFLLLGAGLLSLVGAARRKLSG